MGRRGDAVVLARGGGRRLVDAGVAVALALLILPMVSSGDPNVIQVGDGTELATWTLDAPGDYAVDNVSMQGGMATLLTRSFVWRDATAAEFATGTPSGVNLTEIPGEMILDTESSQLLLNPGFDVDANWTSQVVDPDGTSGGTGHALTGGLGGGPSWFVVMTDLTSLSGFQVWYWLNQSVDITSAPRGANLTGWRLLSFDSDANPGAMARIVLRAPSGIETVVDSTGWTNVSDPGYVEMGGDITPLLPLPGLYEVSLFTHMNSTGNASHMLNMTANWDDVTLAFSRFTTTGAFLSRVFDAGSVVDWEWVFWNETEPVGTDVSVAVRSGNTPVPDGSWGGWSSPYADPSNNTFTGPNGTYAQYAVWMNTTNTSITPVLSEINVGYTRYEAVGRLETADLVPSQLRKWGFFSSTAATPPGADIVFYYSTNGGSAWSPVPAGGDLTGADTSSGLIRFRAVFTTANTTITPMLDTFQLTYVAEDPVMQLEVASPAAADAGAPMQYVVHYNNTGGGTAVRVWVNVTLPLEMSLEATFPPPNTSVGTIHGWTFDSVGPGAHNFTLSVALDPGLPNGLLVNATFRLEYVDPLGGSRPAVQLTRGTGIRGPIIGAEVAVDKATADINEVLHHTIWVNNTGGGTSPRAWVNLTLNSNLDYVNSTGVLFDIVLRWEIQDLAGGEGAVLHLNTSVNETTANGADIVNLIMVQYVDMGGFRRQTQPQDVATLVLRRSNLTLNLAVDTPTASPGDSVVLTVDYDNLGSGIAAAAWVNVSLPPGLVFERSNLGDPALVIGGLHSWTLGQTHPGPHSFTIVARVNGSVGDGESLTVNATLAYVDANDGVIVNEWAGEVSLRAVVVPTIWERIFWPWSPIIIIALLAALYAAARVVFAPPPPRVEELFLGYRDGRLLAHVARTRRLKEEIDEDILSGMLQAIQTFVQDSFTEGRGGVIRRLEFGESKLFVERGEYLYLAVIHGGTATRKFEEAVGEAITRIEDETRDVLREWDGSLEGLDSVDGVLDGFMAAWGAETEAEAPVTVGEEGVPTEVEEERWRTIREHVAATVEPEDVGVGRPKCGICKGSLREELAREACPECGSVYHQPCAVRAGACPRCGAALA